MYSTIVHVLYQHQAISHTSLVYVEMCEINIVLCRHHQAMKSKSINHKENWVQSYITKKLNSQTQITNKTPTTICNRVQEEWCILDTKSDFILSFSWIRWSPLSKQFNYFISGQISFPTKFGYIINYFIIDTLHWKVKQYFPSYCQLVADQIVFLTFC